MRKTLAIALALCTVFAFTVSAMAANNGNGKTVAAVNEYAFDVNNANFHCNDIEGENGRVWPDLTKFGVTDGKGNGGSNKSKTAEKFNVSRVDDSTKWTLNDTVVCPSCGKTEWFTFSNNSGVPDGNNVQFQHEGPSKRWITIKVIYNVEIPKCDFTCVNADAKCETKCTCIVKPCAYLANYPSHDCTWKCSEGHDCIFDDPDLDLTCGTVCACAKSLTRTIVNLKELIVIKDGILFEHAIPTTWEGGALVSGSPISETLYKSKTYNVYYVGKGDCKCECDPVACDAVCIPCNFTPSHEHTVICDNCKNGVGNNHCNHEGQNPENNTNYFCLECGIKLGSFNGNQGWRDADNNDGTELLCLCPVCVK